MDITWLGASCFRLQAGAISVLTDPFDLPTAGAAMSANIVTVSQREALGQLMAVQPYRLVDGPGEYEIKGVPVTGVATLRRAVEGVDPAAKNFIYTIQLDGVTICHLGRLNRPPASQDVQEIGAPDVLLMPIGEPGGLTVQHAVALASQLEAKILVPVLVASPGDRGALERFCRELGSDPANTENRLSVTSSGLPASARVVVLSAQDQPAPPR